MSTLAITEDTADREEQFFRREVATIRARVRSRVSMPQKPRAAISWSGGKDSCAALHRTSGIYDVVSMVTMFDEAGARSRSHGLRPEVLDAQADRLGMRRITGRCTWETYDAAFAGALEQIAADGVTHVVFGDICSRSTGAGPSGCAARSGLRRSSRSGASRPMRCSTSGSPLALKR